MTKLKCVLALLLLTGLFCSKPNFDMDYQLDIPSDVQFLFVPDGIDIKAAMVNSSIETGNTNSSMSSAMKFNANIPVPLVSSLNWNSSGQTSIKAISTKYILSIPSIKPNKVIFIKETKKLPESLCDSSIFKRINHVKFTKFSAGLLSSKLQWLDTMALARHCDIVLIGDFSCHLILSDTIRNYIVKIDAIMGSKNKP